jgi:carbon storage regulator
VLVLSRKHNEEIIVPDHGIVIRILEIRGSKVRLGITAPSNTGVYRQEVWERVGAFRAEVPDATARGEDGHHERVASSR